MPGLYGYSGNANVAVGNTIGLYQQNTGTVQVLSSAQLLLSLLSNASTVGFSLTGANTQVQGTVLPSGVSSGTYGDGSAFPVVTVDADGRVSNITLLPFSSASGLYSNANVASYLPVYGGTINSGTIFNDSGFAIQGRDYTQMQYTNGVTPPVSEYDIGVGAWFYIDAGGGVFQSNTTGNLKTITFGHDASITAGGNVTAPFFIGDGSLLTNLSNAPGAYGNANVASYMPVYGGNFLSNLVLVTNTGIAGSPSVTISPGNVTIGQGSIVGGLAFTANTDVVKLVGGGSATSGNSFIVSGGNVKVESGNYYFGDGSKLINLPVQAGTYSNTNVAAYLTTATISTSGNITAGNLTTAGNVSANYVLGNAALMTGLTAASAGVYGSASVIPTIVVDSTGRITQITTNTATGGSYGNSNVTALLSSNTVTTITTTGNITTVANIVSPAYLYPNGVSILSGIGGTYSNANVASFLPVYNGNIGSGSNVMNNINLGGTITVAPNIVSSYTATTTITSSSYNTSVASSGTFVTLTASTGNIFAGSSTGNTSIQDGAIVTSGAITAGNVLSTGGYFWANGTAYSTGSGGASTYGNANVAAYLPVFGGNILAGNVDIPYIAGTRNRGPLAIGGNLNHYDSGVVASFQGNETTYLYTSLQNTNTGNTAYSSYAVNDGTHTYYGELGINSGTYDYAAAGYPNNAFSKPYATFIQSTGANLAIGTYDNNGISFLVNGQTTTADAMTIANTGNVTVTGNLAVGRIASTNGYFWANGTAYSTGGGTSFTGNLLGSTLTDSVNGRIVANASPQQNITQVGSYTQGVVVNTPPSYTGANLNSQNQTVAMVINGNVSLLTTYANATLRTTNGTTAYLGVTATSANTSMNPSDRVRAFVSGLDLNLNGKNWGLLTSASNTLTPIVTNGQTQNLYGTGQVGQTVAIGSAINITPVNGSISAQYVTSNFPSITYATTGGGYTASNINTARLYSGAMTATANLTITNAIALHTFSGWVSSNVSLVTNAYTVLNEDSRSIIQTNGNLTVTGALATTGNLRINGYDSPAKNYYDTGTTANIVVSGTNTKSFQQIALNANATIYSSVLGFDTVYDFSIQQDGTGGRTLGWFQTGGAYTPTGVLNPAPYSVTYARAIMSDTGYWTVSYSNASVPVLTVTQTNAFTGQAGQIVAVSNGTAKNNGQLAYWDVTNTRWSWVDTNLAVT